MGDLVDALRPYRRIGFDTPVFVYHIEQAPRWAKIVGTVMRALADGQFTGVTSILTLMELAIKPLRLGRPAVADEYALLVQDVERLAIVALDARVARIGAELRAKWGVRTPAALQIAACLAGGADAFLTNDRTLRRIDEIDVFILDDFVEH